MNIKARIATVREIAQHHRPFVVAVFGAVVLGMAGGFWITRPRPRALVFPPMDPNTGCGAVSLAMIGHWLGAPRTIEELNNLTHSYESGTSSLLDLKEASQSMGLAAEPIRLDPTRPLPWTLPMVLHLHETHFVAVLPIDGDHLVIADPPKPPKVLDRRRLVGDWQGVALLVAPSPADLNRALARACLRPASPEQRRPMP